MGIAEELESPQCMKCAHKEEGDLICKAYPFGIPGDIFRNEILHDRILDDQFGDFIYKGV